MPATQCAQNHGCILMILFLLVQGAQARYQACLTGWLWQQQPSPHLSVPMYGDVYPMTLQMQALIHRDVNRELPEDFNSVLSVFLGGPHRSFYMPSLLPGPTVAQTIKDAFRFPVCTQQKQTQRAHPSHKQYIQQPIRCCLMRALLSGCDCNNCPGTAAWTPKY